MLLSELLLEELMEKRDFYLYTLKHLEFKSFDDQNPVETAKIMESTLDELKKIESQIRNLLNSDFQ